MRLVRVLLVLFFCAQAAMAETERYIFFMTGPGDGISPQRPERIAPERFEAIMRHFEGLPESQVRVGLSAIFSYLHHPPEKVQAALRNFLNAAEQTGTPVTVKLDGEQWWGHRPDLWNWWNPAMPGYDPKNALNVEWTGWGPEHAVKVAWRDWGRQLRVAPPPNLASREYREACYEAMGPLLETIRAWRAALPPEKRDLLVAIEVGWESAIGVNSFTVEDNHDWEGRPEADDPKFERDRTKLLNRGVATQGYAAVSTMGWQRRGDLRYEHQVEVVRRHLADLARHVRQAGFPRELVFTHGWGNEEGELLHDAAVNEYSCPGWSSYWYSNRLHEDTGITRGIEKSDAPYWAAVEWLFLHRFEQAPWKAAFENTLFYKNCRYLTFYNWEKIEKSDRGGEIIEAAREVIIENRKSR